MKWICSQHISEFGKLLTNYRFEVKCLIINRVDFRVPVAKNIVVSNKTVTAKFRKVISSVNSNYTFQQLML